MHICLQNQALQTGGGVYVTEDASFVASVSTPCQYCFMMHVCGRVHVMCGLKASLTYSEDLLLSWPEYV